jgi:cellobiose phosphorylase
MERFGHFDEETGEYVVTTPRTTRPLENFLFNDRFFACVHQTGNGFSRYTDPRGYATTIVKGGTEPAHNGTSRVIYVRDDATGEFWSVGYYPVGREPDRFECRQAPACTLVQNRTAGVEAIWRLFVPQNRHPVEIWTLSLRNDGQGPRELSVFAVAVFSLESSVGTYGHESYLNSLPLRRSYGVAARKIAMSLPNPYFAAVLLSRRRPASWDGALNAFTEPFRTLANPIALEKGRCSGAIASRDPVAGVLHFRLRLRPGRIWRNDFVAGAADVFRIETECAALARRYLCDDGAAVERVLARTRRAILDRTGRVSIRTDDGRFDRLFNQWIPRLIEWGVTSGRWGMLGYRDIVQQAQGFLMFDAGGKSRSRLDQALRHQYISGRAVRSFPAVHEDSAMQYADSSLWLIDAVTEYVKETGDFAFLRQGVPYLDRRVQEPVLRHLERSMDALWSDRGAHGLCRIHQGDWNDSLTHVGREGRGESVMLTQSYAKGCRQMEELLLYLRRPGSARVYRQRHGVIRRALNRHAWDGAWYVRGFDDRGKAIGSRTCREGRIFLNSQSWGLLSDTVPPERLNTVLRSIRRRLWTPYGYAMLAPTFTRRTGNIGRLSCLEPGCSENGSVYTHANAFLATALLHAGRPDMALEILQRIMPYNPENPSDAVIPFQLSNGYGGPAHRNDPGRAQFGWSTGSGAWLHQAVVEFLLGARRGYDGLRLRPCLPSSWPAAALTRVYRDCRYEIEYVRTGAGQRVRHLLVNGREYDPDQPLPVLAGSTVRVRAVVRE